MANFCYKAISAKGKTVRGLVEAHGGTASALAGPNGRGATIMLRLPLAAAPIDDGT